MKAMPTPMTLIMLAIFSGLVATAFTYPPAARFMPLTIGIPAIALCLLQLALDIYQRRKPVTDHRPDLPPQGMDPVTRIAGQRVHFEMPSDNALFVDNSRNPRDTLRREVVVWSAFLGLILGILLFGFRITVPVFLIGFLRFQAGVCWRHALIYGGAGALLMHVLFERVLRVSLHAGFLTDLIFGWFAP